MPTASDAVVVAYRRWLDRHTRGRGATWTAYAPPDALAHAPRLPRAACLERRLSHVAHCAHCSRALRALGTIGAIANGLVVAGLLLGALGAASRRAAVHAAGCGVAAAAFGAARGAAALMARFEHGRYPPPRNVRA